MGISITLYHLTEPTNVVNKTLDGTSAIKLNAQLEPTGPINLINPVFIVDTGVASTYSNLSSMNYLYAGAPLNRYYFITSLDFTVAKKAIIGCHVDVLMTFRSRINTTTLNYTRGAGDINEMDDSSYPISDYMVQQYFNFTNWTDIFHSSGSERQFLLRTVKGSAEIGEVYDMNINQAFWIGETEYDSEGNVHYWIYYVSSINSAHKLNIEKARVSTLSPGTPFIHEKDYFRMTCSWHSSTGLWQFTGGATGNPQSAGAFKFKGHET